MLTSQGPLGHLGWVFAGSSVFAGRVATFLAAGLERRERLMVVVDDPRPGQWPDELIERGHLLVLSTAEVYGADRMAEPEALRAEFRASLTEAHYHGYAGLRVAADNTSLTLGPDRLEAWLRWEAEADSLMRREPITGLCAFDNTRTHPDTLAALTAVHPAAAFPGT